MRGRTGLYEARKGSSISTLNLEEQTAKKPLRVLMVTGIYPTEQKPHSGTFIKTQVVSLREAGIEVEVINPKPGPVLFRYISAIRQVFLKTLGGRFDVVHGHSGQWCLFARMQWTTPVVSSFLGSDLLMGGITSDERIAKKGIFIAHISRWLCSHVDAVTVKTEQMKKAAAGDNITVYSDGIDFDLFRPIPRADARVMLGWEQDRYYVLFGNNPQRPEKNYSLAKATIDRIQDRGISAELVVANGLPQTTLVQYINASNAVILSSIYEGSPNIVKEAMACNVPVVSTNVGDVSQLIGHTRGCSVCQHDPNALATALLYAFQHTEPTTGRSDIAHLEKSVIARRIISIYEDVMKKKGAKHVFKEKSIDDKSP